MPFKELLIKINRIQKNMRRTINEADITAYASSSAFFLFLSVIPMIIILKLFLVQISIDYKDMLNLSNVVIPVKVHSFLVDIAEEYDEVKTNMTILSVYAVVIVWSASKGMLAIIRGMNHIYEIYETRNYIILRIKAIIYTLLFLLAIALSIVILVFGNTIIDVIISFSENFFIPGFLKIFGLLRHFVVALIISVIFCTMYYLLPDRKHTKGYDAGYGKMKWKDHYFGAVFTSVFWTIYSFGFSIYIEYFDGFKMYGSLTTIVIVMIWLYFCMYIFFCGALINKCMNDEMIN